MSTPDAPAALGIILIAGIEPRSPNPNVRCGNGGSEHEGRKIQGWVILKVKFCGSGGFKVEALALTANGQDCTTAIIAISSVPRG